MKPDDALSELEAELDWRTKDILFLQNMSQALCSDWERDSYRRALVVMLYSHFEGFVKFALLVYTRAVNEAAIPCSDATYAIAAASLADVFNALRNQTAKSPEFRSTAPDDTKLHIHAREREFMERVVEIYARPVIIPEGLVDMESNLKPVVLRKNLYRLGFPHDMFKQHEGNIDRLLQCRNGICHGRSRTGVGAKDYAEVKESALKIMADVRSMIYEAIREQSYLRQCRDSDKYQRA